MSRFLKYFVSTKTWQARMQRKVLAKFAPGKGQNKKGMRKKKMVYLVAGQR